MPLQAVCVDGKRGVPNQLNLVFLCLYCGMLCTVCNNLRRVGGLLPRHKD
jgi:hypothetical protein